MGKDKSKLTSTGQEKRTRRRLRVSCVECSRRRQGCDRNRPCGLCVQRNVSHLCRWEQEPFPRPVPARPPPSDEGSDIRRASNGIGRSKDQDHAKGNDGVHNKPRRRQGKSKRGARGGRDRGGDERAEAAMALSQLAAGPHICPTTQPGADSVYDGVNSIQDPLYNSLQTLFSSLPSKEKSEKLLEAFLKKENWRFGLPEQVFMFMHRRMWDALEAGDGSPTSGAGGVDVNSNVNVNWLVFLFAVFALSPAAGTDGEGEEVVDKEKKFYFLRAMFGRRLLDGFPSLMDIQDMGQSYYSSSPSSPSSSSTGSQTSYASGLGTLAPQMTGGVVYNCLAVVLLATYMADQGHVKDAWFLVGTGVRLAQSVNMHLEGGFGVGNSNEGPLDLRKGAGIDVMDDEVFVRKLTWSLLCVQDGVFSLILSKPPANQVTMFRGCDEPLPKAIVGTLESDGSSDTTLCYLTLLTSLNSIVLRLCDMQVKPSPSPYATTLALEQVFEEWEKNLPAGFAFRETRDQSPRALGRFVPNANAAVHENARHAGIHPYNGNYTNGSSTDSNGVYALRNGARQQDAYHADPIFDLNFNLSATLDAVYPYLKKQRLTLAILYLEARMLLNRPFVFSPPPILPMPALGFGLGVGTGSHFRSGGSTTAIERNPNKEMCVTMAGEIVRVLTEVAGDMRMTINDVRDGYAKFSERSPGGRNVVDIDGFGAGRSQGQAQNLELTQTRLRPGFLNTFCAFDGAATLAAVILQDANESGVGRSEIGEWKAKVDQVGAWCERAGVRDVGGIGECMVRAVDCVKWVVECAIGGMAKSPSEAGSSTGVNGNRGGMGSPSKADKMVILKPPKTFEEMFRELMEQGGKAVLDTHAKANAAETARTKGRGVTMVDLVMELGAANLGCSNRNELRDDGVWMGELDSLARGLGDMRVQGSSRIA